MELYDAFQECVELGEKYVHVENGADYFLRYDGSTLKIFFECSNGREDWRSNFQFFVVPWVPYKHMTCIWLCHRGFLKLWKSIEPYIKDDILNPKVERIEIVGYSQGAAIAVLCYEYAKFFRPTIEVEGVGFGCPRVFWGIVPKQVRERFRDFKVIRNGHDLVTHVPPMLLGYRHVSKVVKIGHTNFINDHRPERYKVNLQDKNLNI